MNYIFKGTTLQNTFDNALNLFHYEFYQNNQTLKINNLNYNIDAGIYECIATNNINQVKANAKLTIIPATLPYFKIAQQNISVFEDHSIILECFANGSPKPQGIVISFFLIFTLIIIFYSLTYFFFLKCFGTSKLLFIIYKNL
jgi:hypothetical protein